MTLSWARKQSTWKCPELSKGRPEELWMYKKIPDVE